MSMAAANGDGIERERSAVMQLDAASRIRRQRMRKERVALGQRERALQQAVAHLTADEALLRAQRDAWRDRWRSWARGGCVAEAAGLRRDHATLCALARLIDDRRSALRSDRVRLDDAWDDWRRRERAARQLDDALHDRELALHRTLRHADERRHEEDALSAHRPPWHRSVVPLP